jgi:hypothetical protein
MLFRPALKQSVLQYYSKGTPSPEQGPGSIAYGNLSYSNYSATLSLTTRDAIFFDRIPQAEFSTSFSKQKKVDFTIGTIVPLYPSTRYSYLRTIRFIGPVGEHL